VAVGSGDDRDVRPDDRDRDVGERSKTGVRHDAVDHADGARRVALRVGGAGRDEQQHGPERTEISHHTQQRCPKIGSPPARPVPGRNDLGAKGASRIAVPGVDDYYTDDDKLHSPAGAFNRDEIKVYFAALRESFTDFTISRAQILADGTFVAARTVMAGRFDKEFAYTPIGAVKPNGQQVQWELINIFRYTDEGRLVEEWVQTDTYDFLRKLGALAS
jgi:predicted ester cyclase